MSKPIRDFGPRIPVPPSCENIDRTSPSCHPRAEGRVLHFPEAQYCWESAESSSGPAEHTSERSTAAVAVAVAAVVERRGTFGVFEHNTPVSLGHWSRTSYAVFLVAHGQAVRQENHPPCGCKTAIDRQHCLDPCTSSAVAGAGRLKWPSQLDERRSEKGGDQSVRAAPPDPGTAFQTRGNY